MNIKYNIVIIFETILIALLLIFSVYSYDNYKLLKQKESKKLRGFLSPNIYANLIEPKEFNIVKFTPLESKIHDYIEKNKLNASVYIENLKNGADFSINENEGFFPASLNKLPIAIIIMEKIESGQLRSETEVEILDSERSNLSGTLYKNHNKDLTVQELLEALLRESDNTAFNALSRFVSDDELERVLDYYDLDLNETYKFHYGYAAKNHSLVTVKATSNVLSSLYFSTVLEPEDSDYLLSLLTDTVFDIKKIAGLPDEVAVAHKFGAYYHQNSQFFHDCGILYIQKSRMIYCIMTKNAEPKNARNLFGFVVNETYHFVLDSRAKLDVYQKQGQI